VLPQSLFHAPTAPIRPTASPRHLHAEHRAVQKKLRFVVFYYAGRVQKIHIIRVKICQIAQQRTAVIAQSGEIVEKPLGIITNSIHVLHPAAAGYFGLGICAADEGKQKTPTNAKSVGVFM